MAELWALRVLSVLCASARYKEGQCVDRNETNHREPCLPPKMPQAHYSVAAHPSEECF